MRKFLSLVSVLVVLALAAGCDQSPTNGGEPTPTPVPIAVTGITVQDRTVTFTITGPAEAGAFLPEVRCPVEGGWYVIRTTGLPTGWETYGLPTGTYSLTIPVKDRGEYVDQACGGAHGILHVARGGSTWIFDANIAW